MKKAAQAVPNQRLVDERLRRHLSQQEIADLVGTTPINVGRWERGITSPGAHFRSQLCTLFAKSAQELGLLQAEVVTGSISPIQPVVSDSSTTTGSPGVCPPFWNIPLRRNPFFTGREDILKRLHDTLWAGNAAAFTQPQAISGLGGIGKTQTAIEYAYRYGNEYQAVLWVRTETREVLISDLAAIASLLCLPEKDEQDQDRAVEAVKRWLNCASNWLLILDNVEDLTMIRDLLVPARKGHILLTTRAQVTGMLAQCIDLEKMEWEEAALFLLRRAKRLAPDSLLKEASTADGTAARDISQVLDGFPLALDQAGAYIEETACEVSNYLDYYTARRASLLKLRGTVIADHTASVTTTFALAIEQVEQANPAAADLLRLCAFLHPDAIAEEIITAGAPELDPVLQITVLDPFALDAALKALRHLSLLRRSPVTRTLTVHRLVQAVLKDGMDEDTQRQWAERTVRAVNRAFPTVEPATWPRCERCLPHALVCAALIAQWAITFLEASCLLHQAALYLCERAQYAQAEVLYQQALTMREQAVGSGHPDVAETLNSLGELYYYQGKYALAETLHQRALAIREKALGSEHVVVAESLNNLAVSYYEQNKNIQAEQLFQQALAIRERTLGTDHLSVAETLNNMAILYYDQEKYEQAELLCQRALSIHEKVLGPEHPVMAHILNILALVFYKQGRYEQAESFCQRALSIREEVLGSEHPHIAYCLNILALIYNEQRKYEQAELLCRRALSIRERALGSEHPHVATSLYTLANCYSKQNKYEQAELLYRRSLNIRERALGSKHLDVAQSLNSLALLYYTQGKYAQAESFYWKALVIRKQALGSEHPHVVESLNALTYLYSDQGKYVQAEELFQQVQAMGEKMVGFEHSDVVLRTTSG